MHMRDKAMESTNFFYTAQAGNLGMMNLMMNLMMIVFLLAGMWFLIIALPRKKQKAKKAATKNYVKPEIASVTHGFGVAAIAISVLGAIMLAAEEQRLAEIAIGIGFSGSLTGIALMALAVIVDRTARTAYNTSVISDLISSDSGKVKKLLFEQVQVQNKILDSQQVPQIAELSYYLVDAPEEPVSLSTLNEMYSNGRIYESTSVFREGDSDWSTYGDFME
jgi:preprotein translocase subunit YajC